VVYFQLAIPATAATNSPRDESVRLADLPPDEAAVVDLPGIGEIAVAEQNPKLYILDRHNEI
jgi:hypothetical protein